MKLEHYLYDFQNIIRTVGLAKENDTGYDLDYDLYDFLLGFF